MLLALRLLYESAVTPVPPTPTPAPVPAPEGLPGGSGSSSDWLGVPIFPLSGSAVIKGASRQAKAGNILPSAGAEIKMPGASLQFKLGQPIISGSGVAFITGASLRMSNQNEMPKSTVTLGSVRNFDGNDDEEAMNLILQHL